MQRRGDRATRGARRSALGLVAIDVVGATSSSAVQGARPYNLRSVPTRTLPRRDRRVRMRSNALRRRVRGSQCRRSAGRGLARRLRARRRRTRPRNGRAERLYAEAKEEAAAGNYERADQAATSGSKAAPPARCWRSRRSSTSPTAYWKTGEKAQALSTLERFIKLHPTSPALDYALYLRGLVNFNDNLGILGSLARQDLSERDQQASRDAYQSFKQLVEQFPQSTYADDARAAHELHRQLAGRLRGPRRALLLPARRLRGGGQPRAAGGAGVPAARRRPRRRCTSWRRATTASA